MRISPLFVTTLVAAYAVLQSAAAGAQTIDAVPIERFPPDMPKFSTHSGHCLVTFDVSTEGSVFNLSVHDCTDSLFIDATRSSVKKWKYSPKTIAGRAVVRKDIESKIKYRLSTQRGDLIDEALPATPTPQRASRAARVRRMDKRMAARGSIGSCCMMFDVSQLGRPINVSDQSCPSAIFAERAEGFVRHLRYKPVVHEGSPVSTADYQLVINFIDASFLRSDLPPYMMIAKGADASQSCGLVS